MSGVRWQKRSDFSSEQKSITSSKTVSKLLALTLLALLATIVDLWQTAIVDITLFNDVIKSASQCCQPKSL